VIISLHNNEIDSWRLYLKETLPEPYSSKVDMALKVFSVQGRKLRIKKKLPIGYVDITADAWATGDGRAEIDIDRAQLLNTGVFGAIRKIAGDLVIGMVNEWPNIFSAKKVGGNIVIEIKGLFIRKLKIEENSILLEADVRDKER
jgi:hypothetical protein